MIINENLKQYLDKVESKSYFKKIKKLVKIFENSGMIARSSRHCIGISDLVQKLLNEYGIDSYLEECSLTVISRDPFCKVDLLAHDTNNQKNIQDIDTHVICITKTEIPILIDLSIEYITKKIDYVVFPIFPEFVSNEVNILTVDFGSSLWIYNKKEIGQIPRLHEKSIIERIKTDIQFQKQINTLKKIVIFIATVSSLNFIRGLYDHYQQYIVKDNQTQSNRELVDKTEKNVYK